MNRKALRILRASTRSAEASDDICPSHTRTISSDRVRLAGRARYLGRPAAFDGALDRIGSAWNSHTNERGGGYGRRELDSGGPALPALIIFMTQDRRVREATSLEKLAGRYTKLTRRGNVSIGRCPFHEEKTGSFRVNLRGHKYAGRWRCFGCGSGGDALDFYQRIENCSAWEALQALAVAAGIVLAGKAQETPDERAGRLRNEQDAPMIEWWYRQRWIHFRGILNRLIAGEGMQEPGSPEERLADHCGQVCRWIEKNKDNFAVARAAGATSARNRAAFQRDTRARREREQVLASRLEYAAYLGEFALAHAKASGYKDPDDFIRKYGGEAYRRGIERAVEI